MTRIYVGRLEKGTRDRDLERFFRGFGRIREIALKPGYGFVVSRNLFVFDIRNVSKF